MATLSRAIACTVAIAATVGCGTAAAADSCTALGGTIGADQTCRIHSVTPAYEITMAFPLGYPDQRSVAEFLRRDRDEFVEWVADFGPDRRDRPYQYVVTARSYHSGPPDAGTRSLVLEIENDTGLANQGHPDTTFEAFNFDADGKTPITFATLFKPGAAPLTVLNPILQRELGASPVALDETAYQNFAITDDAVLFFFGQNQVVQDDNGPHEIAVARAQLAQLLA